MIALQTLWTRVRAATPIVSMLSLLAVVLAAGAGTKWI